MNQTIIAQSSTPVASPPSALTEWGILGAIVFLVVKEGIAFLKQKDTQEGALTSTLIADIRDTNRELRTYLEEERKASKQTLDELSRMEQRLSRQSTELIVDNRERVAKVIALVEALHARLDQVGVTNSHSQ
jgi:hypothetical protein